MNEHRDAIEYRDAIIRDWAEIAQKENRKATEILEALKQVHDYPCAQERTYRRGNHDNYCFPCFIIEKYQAAK